MANQYEADPRQQLFLSYYLDPKSATFSNATKSGIKAGYGPEYSESILSKDLDWLSESIERSSMLRTAEKNLNKAMNIPIDDEKIGERCLKASIFVAKGLGKDIYSERTELTGKDGKDLVVQPINYADISSTTQIPTETVSTEPAESIG